MLTTFAEKLKAQLNNPLPGKEAHKKMSPHRRFPYQKSPNILHCKLSAVMILLYEKDDAIYLPIIVRPTYDGVHSGQLSFPGGKRENQDIDNLATALRETEEEIGIRANDITIIGELTSLYIPKSNFMVYPFVGYIKGTPLFNIETNEVDSLVHLSLSSLSDESIKSSYHFKAGDIDIIAPCWKIDGHDLWGATAMILAELEELIQRIKL